MVHSFTSQTSSAVARCTLAMLLGGLASTSAVAQQNLFSSGPSSTIPWPGAVQPSRAVWGDFTGDEHDDVVFVTADGSARFVYGPGTYSVHWSLGTGIVDVAHVARGPGTTDGLLVLDGDGLALHADYSGGSLSVTALSAGAPWNTALRAVSDDADGDGLADAIGVAADGQTILFSSDVLQGATSPTSFGVPGSVLDLVVADWGPGPAIVTLTTDGLHVFRHTGAVLDAYGGGNISAGQLTVFREQGRVDERTAAVYTVPGSGDFVSVVDQHGPADIVPLGAIGAYGIASGDVDGDLHDDLVVLQSTNHFGILMRHQRVPGDPFGQMEPVNCGLGSAPASSQTGSPILADLTNDGDLDLLVHLAATEELALVENMSADRTTMAPEVVDGVYLYSYQQGQGELQLDVLQPPGLSFAADGVELVVWVEDPREEEGGMQPGALHHLTFDLDAAGMADTAFTIEESDVETSFVYHIEMRAVATQGQQVLEAGPTAVWSFSTAGGVVAQLESQSGNEGVPIRVFLIDEVRFMTASEEDERVLTPSTVKGDKVPPIDEPPDPFDET